jgi:2-polyprenyl-6-hydroxyphenyl methylase/3-demethylubiquinone-9 3-methyltransferase
MRRFIATNVALCELIDRLLPERLRTDGNARFLKEVLPRALVPGSLVYDIGGGARPYVSPEEKVRLGLRVVGLDISAAELAAAPPGAYDRVIVADLCTFTGPSDGDQVICQALLEHVPDAAAAIRALATTTRPGGRIFLFAPSRNALFARLNLMLPERLKRRILFAIFPSKARGHDGFRAWYDCCTPGAVERLARANGLEVEERQLFWISSYFKPFVPAFVAWRMFQGFAWLLFRDNAAETFYFVLRKRDAA